MILLDVNMPGMDGFETASLIHQHPRFEKHADHLRHRGQRQRPRPPARLQARRGRLRDGAGDPGDPAHQGRRCWPSCSASAANCRLRQRARLAAANEALQAEKARELNGSTSRCARPTPNWRSATATCSRDRRAHAGRGAACAKPTGARTSSSPRSRTSCAIRWRRCRTRSTSAGCRRRRDDPLQDMMERQLGQLVRLIDDLLDVARITRGKLDAAPGARRRCSDVLRRGDRNGRAAARSRRASAAGRSCRTEPLPMLRRPAAPVAGVRQPAQQRRASIPMPAAASSVRRAARRRRRSRSACATAASA